MERKQARERPAFKNTIGFERNGIIPKDKAPPYEPPEDWPDDAGDYLKGLTRCGTLTGACKVSGVSPNRPYKWRKSIGEDFREEEEFCKDLFIDVQEQSLFECGLGEVSGMARVKALDRILTANRPEKYDRAQKHQVEGDVNVTWVDIMKQAEEQEEE